MQIHFTQKKNNNFKEQFNRNKTISRIVYNGKNVYLPTQVGPDARV